MWVTGDLWSLDAGPNDGSPIETVTRSARFGEWFVQIMPQFRFVSEINHAKQ